MLCSVGIKFLMVEMALEIYVVHGYFRVKYRADGRSAGTHGYVHLEISVIGFKQR